MPPFQPPRPTLTRGRALRALSDRLRGHGDDGLLGEEVWSLVSARRLEVELDRATLHDRTVRPFADPELFSPGVDLGIFERYRDSEVRERVSVLTRPAFVDPRLGWVVDGRGHLVRRGLVNIHAVPAPSVASYVRARTRPGRMRRVPVAIHLRDRAESVYGHVLQELIGGRLRLADACGLQDVPIVVSRSLFDRPYFQELLRIADLSDRVFVVQDGDYLRAETLYLFDTSAFLRESIEHIVRILQVPEADPASQRRIFLVRKLGQRTGRGIVNMDDVQDVCRRFDFELCSPDDMTLEQQIELFSQARVVAGVHGSALVNIVFRRAAPLTLIEILPPGADLRRPRPWWFFESAVLGHDHELLVHDELDDGVVGKAVYRRDFAVDPTCLAGTLASVVDRI